MAEFRQMLINEQYLTVKKIGQGGFGIVWRAYDFSLRNYVAIKELLKEYNEPKYIEMLYKEALIAKNLIHENIVRVQHFWKGSNGSYYISMDYVTGKDLEHVINVCNKQKIRLPWELCVLIASGVLKAIDYANRLAKDTITGKPYGLIYRDISPGNVMISFDGNVKLSDFGIAKTADEMSDGIKKRVITGKYSYMSPEQIMGDPDVDHRSDIFSIGVVLYEMLTGSQLYKGEPQEIREQITGTKFDPALLDNMNLPFELAGIIEKALEKDKESRYEKAIEMFRDLRRLLKGKETEELTENLSMFLARTMPEELAADNELGEQVKQLNMQEIKSTTGVWKITCKDFIVGETETGTDGSGSADQVFVSPHSEPLEQPEPPVEQKTKPPSQPQPQEQPRPQAQQRTPVPAEVVEQSPRQAEEAPIPPPPPFVPPKPEASKGEEKGKTVFEEVGDWLVNKFKIYRKRMIRFTFALVIAFAMFTVVDTFVHITPMGKMIYSRIYPPDIVITTVPVGATVSLKTRDGKTVLNDADSTQPIELRKVTPGIYMLTAAKQNFRTVERVVRIEEPGKGPGGKVLQRIDINFEFTLAINSVPPGADVFVDGNKFNVTPCKGEFTAGEHTIKIQLKGFEELGSMAKESRAGACNIDFTRPNPEDAFGGVDKKYWTYQIQNAEGGVIFNLTGLLFKKISLSSVPSNVIIHIDGENQARGNTPITIPLKSGEYKVRFLDPEGKYEEGLRQIKVTEDSETHFSCYLNKWVTIKIRSKEHHNEAFMTNVRVSGSGVKLVSSISTGKPFRVALPVGVYNIVFDGDKEYRTLIMKNVDISDKSMIQGEMEYENTQLKITVKDDVNKKPINEAFVWISNKVAGKTDGDGVWQDAVIHGTTTIKIVAKGFVEKSMEKELNTSSENIEFLLKSDRVILSTAAPRILPPLPDRTKDFSLPAAHKVESNMPQTQNGFSSPEGSAPAVQQQAAPQQGGKKIIVCPNCGKVYEVVPGKKLRFCINCGHPLSEKDIRTAPSQ